MMDGSAAEKRIAIPMSALDNLAEESRIDRVVQTLEQHTEPFRLGVTIKVMRERIGTDRPPIIVRWEKHKAPRLVPAVEESAPEGRLKRRQRARLGEYAHEVELVGRVRIKHYLGTERMGTSDCDVNPLAEGPRVVIEAEDAKIVR